MPVRNIFMDFISLIFPKLCAGCRRGLQLNEDCICTFCHYQLPETNYHLRADNPVAKIFWGRVKLNAAASFYAFNKGGKVQNLIHELKYRGRPDVGILIGKFYGCRIKESELFGSVDLVVPVPLHVDKLKKRGYNQSECFAKGIAESMDITCDPKILKRNADTQTQTNKSRFQRWENINSVFSVNDKNNVGGKHILLVDDVVTTGATLEACAQLLLQVPNVIVSIATIAYAEI